MGTRNQRSPSYSLKQRARYTINALNTVKHKHRHRTRDRRKSYATCTMTNGRLAINRLCPKVLRAPPVTQYPHGLDPGLPSRLTSLALPGWNPCIYLSPANEPYLLQRPEGHPCLSNNWANVTDGKHGKTSVPYQLALQVWAVRVRSCLSVEDHRSTRSSLSVASY